MSAEPGVTRHIHSLAFRKASAEHCTSWQVRTLAPRAWGRVVKEGRKFVCDNELLFLMPLDLTEEVTDAVSASNRVVVAELKKHVPQAGGSWGQFGRPWLLDALDDDLEPQEKKQYNLNE